LSTNNGTKEQNITVNLSYNKLALSSFVLLFLILFLTNLSGWLVDDDEGTDFYEVWLLQEGYKPGIHYIAEQQPLYLLTGSAIVGAAGRSAGPLRTLSVVQLIAGAAFLAVCVGKVFGGKAGVFTSILILSNGMMYQQGRMFRPDPMMLAWQMAGLGFVLLALKTDKYYYWGMAGACYGVGILWKLLGLFPLAYISHVKN
jgi:4-amino-4-deoxy-L-arabinose transferase-like glycosyltransferase